MNTGLLVTFLLATSGAHQPTWHDVLAENKHLLPADSIIPRQLADFSSGLTPKIVDPRVKEIPIVELDDAIINVESNDRVQFMFPDPQNPLGTPLCTPHPLYVPKVRASVYEKLVNMSGQLKMLSPYFGYEPEALVISAFEGLRPLSRQKEYFDKKLSEIQRNHPEYTLEQAEEETSKWVSPVKNNIPVHSTGAAIDIRLWNLHKRESVDLGVFGTIFGPNENAPTFSEGITKEQKNNRLMLLIAADRAGLTNYLFEYWHVSSGDRYAAFYHNEPHAVHGPID